MNLKIDKCISFELFNSIFNKEKHIDKLNYMKKLNNLIILIFTVLIILPNKTIQSQIFQSGVYTNIYIKSQKMTFYSLNGIHYIVATERFVEDENGKKVKSKSTSGMHRSKHILNYTSGPFALYGEDGYFFKKNGKDYYFDELMYIYEGSGKKDSLKYVYVKTSTLPQNWEINPEDRIGEIGVVNKEILYKIIKVESVKLISTPLYGNCVYIKGIGNPLEGIDEFIMQYNMFTEFSISKIINTNLNDLTGKIIQLYFNWESGFLPGHSLEDKLDLENNTRNIPFEIKLLDKKINGKSIIHHPIINRYNLIYYEK